MFSKSGNKLFLSNLPSPHFYLISGLRLAVFLLVELELPDAPPDSDVRQEGDGHAGGREPADVLPHPVRVVELAVGRLATLPAPLVTGLV